MTRSVKEVSVACLCLCTIWKTAVAGGRPLERYPPLSTVSALIELVQKSSEVFIAKAGEPVARLTAYRGAAHPRTPGSTAGQISIVPDFDVLPDNMVEVFGIGERSD
jgi:antitoxin (DNA-binding transcriptional repressor) of toxin-antitoxin stability system